MNHDDPIAKARHALDLWRQGFYGYQRRYMACNARVSRWTKARQVGFSHALAAKGVMRALGGSVNVILSASQLLSDNTLAKARAHARFLEGAGFPRARLQRDRSSFIAFPGGGEVISLPANPRTARGFTGHVYLDEFAYHSDPEGIWDAAAAIAARGDYAIDIVSTPNGASGLFYEWHQRPPEGWFSDEVSVDRAIREGCRVDIAKLWDLAGHDERIFAQWYRCVFLDGTLQYIPTAMVDRALHWTGQTPRELLSRGTFYAGLDIGRENDLTVLTVAVAYDGKAFILPPWTCKRTSFAAQKDMIHAVRAKFGWDKLYIDATGLGMQFSEEMVEEFGDDEAVAVTFTNKVKEDLATRALQWFRDDRVRFPRGKDGQELHRETCEVRRVVTGAGNVVYEVPRTKDGHGDRWWSMCLALKGLGEPPMPRGMGQEPLLAVA
jgi:phage FluMu gp28-like protein